MSVSDRHSKFATVLVRVLVKGRADLKNSRAVHRLLFWHWMQPAAYVHVPVGDQSAVSLPDTVGGGWHAEFFD